MQWKVGIGAAQTSDEVVLKGADGSFCCIAPMDVGRRELKIDMLGVHEGLEGIRGFIVKALEGGSEPTLL